MKRSSLSFLILAIIIFVIYVYYNYSQIQNVEERYTNLQKDLQNVTASISTASLQKALTITPVYTIDNTTTTSVTSNNAKLLYINGIKLYKIPFTWVATGKAQQLKVIVTPGSDFSFAKMEGYNCSVYQIDNTNTTQDVSQIIVMKAVSDDSLVCRISGNAAPGTYYVTLLLWSV